MPYRKRAVLARVAVSLAGGFDGVFDLEGGEPLVVENLADLPSVELEVRVGEMNERDAADKQEQPGVVSLALGLERIVADLVAERFVVDVVFLFEAVAVGVGREYVLVATRINYSRRCKSVTYCNRGKSLW